MASLSILNYSILVLFAFLATPNSCQGHLRHSENDDHVALFLFGDSLFDVGNNNYINTTTTFQANFWPYGETTFNYPTGRPSDGRSIPDFIAEYAKLPLLPPYKQPGNHQFTNGANFASGGAGALVETFQGFVIDLKTQVAYFKDVQKSLMQQLGDNEAGKIISSAVYLFSVGGNDYFTPLSESFSREEYVEMVISNVTDVLQEIYKSGGRKFGFLGLGPLSCLPAARALNPANTGDCREDISAFVKLHNIAFSKVLLKLESKLEGFKYSNFDFNATATERMENPSKYGFKEGKSGCCGSGPYRGVNSCGGKRGVEEYQLCSNASEYIFFDSSHPTEAANQQFAKLMWSGTPEVVWPYNLKALFEQRQV